MVAQRLALLSDVTAAQAQAVPATTFTEAVHDIVAALLVQGTNVTLTYDDTAGKITIDAANSGDPSAFATALGGTIRIKIERQTGGSFPGTRPTASTAVSFELVAPLSVTRPTWMLAGVDTYDVTPET